MRRPSRLPPLLLAVVFAVGGFGLPEADILLDHGTGDPRPELQVHLERPGGASNHAGHCPLNRLLATLQALGPTGGTAVVRAAVDLVLSHVEPAAAALVRHHPSYRSRAPPSTG